MVYPGLAIMIATGLGKPYAKPEIPGAYLILYEYDVY
jgi:hypothetical protein